MSDERELVRKVMEGDFQAFSRLVAQYEKLVFFVVSRLVNQRENVEDLCQDVFLKVHRSLASFKFESKLSTWIARIAYLTAVDHLRKHRPDISREMREDLENVHFTAENPDHLLEEKDRKEWLNQLIARLPENYRTVLTLYHLNGFSLREIHEITGYPEGTTKSYLFRARQMLKERIQIYFKEQL